MFSCWGKDSRHVSCYEDISREDGSDESTDDDYQVDKFPDKEGVAADVKFQEGLYSSVLVATFGQRFDKDSDFIIGGVTLDIGDNRKVPMHPMLLYLMCVPVVLIQYWCILGVAMALPLKDSFRKPGEPFMRMSVKYVMVMLGQAALLTRVLATLRLLFFVLNPLTWLEVCRPSHSGTGYRGTLFGWTRHTVFVFPLVVWTLLQKLSIDYWVSAHGMSVVLAAESMKDAIWDCVAVEFIAQIEELVWRVASTILHLNSFEDFQFKFVPPPRQMVQDYPSLFACLHTWLSQANGGRRLANMLSFAVLGMLQIRLLFIALHAADTGILPTARDICTLWRWETKGDVDSPWVHGIFNLLYMSKSWAPFDISKELSRVADPDEGGYCTDKFMRMKGREVHTLWQEHTMFVSIAIAIFVSFLFIPQVSFYLGSRLYEKLGLYEEDLSPGQTDYKSLEAKQ